MSASIRRYSTNVLESAFKSAMARISSQAMILTAGNTNLTPAQLASTPSSILHGMTISSATSLSVSPKPLMAFNLHLPSYTSSTLHELKYMALHILPPNDRSVILGRTFASGIKPIKSFEDDGELHEKTTPFSGLQEGIEWQFFNKHTEDPNFDSVHIPVLNHAEKVLICKKRLVFEVDAHEIWAVEVEDILSPNEDVQVTGGLLYYNRSFYKTGDKLA